MPSSRHARTIRRAISPRDLPKMTADEGAEFLLKCGKIGHPTDLDLSAAKSVAREMDGLPLGLEQAAAYIEEASLSPGEYLELYRREGKKLRARPAASVDHETVTRTFTLAFEKLGLRAGEILRMAAFLPRMRFQSTSWPKATSRIASSGTRSRMLLGIL